MAAISATLARYPEEVITAVTHPVSGLPSKKSWLPTVKEVFDACEEAEEPIRQAAARDRRIKEQLALREQEDQLRAARPSIVDLKEKYGDNWGLDSVGPRAAERRADENRRALEQQQARVRAEYNALGLEPPSALALSITARRALRLIDEERATRDTEGAE